MIGNLDYGIINPIKTQKCDLVALLITINLLSDTDDPSNEIDDLLLQKERFWISILVTIHKGLNSTHHWNRKRRTEGPKQRLTL